MSNLLHEALERATLREAPGSPLPSGRSFSPNSHTSDSEDDNELISVRTAPPTPRSGSRAGSRSTSPTRKGRISRQQKELEKASSIDPLKRFPNEISSKIFTQITTVQDLLACQRVCKRWRKSATLNYSWFLLFNRTTFIDGGVSGGAQLPVWSRKDSKQDWAVRYKNAFRRDDLEHRFAEDADSERARSDGWRTPQEAKADQWAEENAADDSFSDKVAARAYYKSLGGRKAKDKTGKGGGRKDRSGLGDED